ncbi:MAG: type II toxin-antitoxin system death-on-curing family toxin [Pyrinomonadaceae bacterium]
MIFLHKGEVLALHARAIEEHGGSPEIRDEGALESALVAVQNRFHYEDADAIGCAAAYAYHLTKAHAFLDGNKRVAAVATEIFLHINGVEVRATEKQLLKLYMGIADSSLNRDDVEARLRTLVRK